MKKKHEEFPDPERSRVPEENRGKKIIIILICVVVAALIGLLTWFFVFENDSSYIWIRRHMAENKLEKGKSDAAIELYYKILDRDDKDVDAYLSIGGIYKDEKEFGKGIKILEKGLEKTGDKEIAGLLWEFYQGRLRDFYIDGSYDRVMDEIKNLPEEKLSAFIGEAEDDKYLSEDSRIWKETTERLVEALLADGKQKDACDMLEAAINKPLNVMSDTSSFKTRLIELYLGRAGEAVERGDKTMARILYTKVTVLDPENEEAVAGLEALKDPEEPEEELGSFTAKGNAVLKCSAGMLGLSVVVPVDAEVEFDYDADKEQLFVCYSFGCDVFGKTMGSSGDILLIQKGNDVYRYLRWDDSGWHDDILYGQSLKDTVELMVSDYKNIASSGDDVGLGTAGGEECRIVSEIRDGNDYVKIIPDMLALEEPVMIFSAIKVKATRYLSLADGTPRRVEASLESVDNQKLSPLFAALLGDSTLQIGLVDFTGTMDIDRTLTGSIPAEPKK